MWHKQPKKCTVKVKSAIKDAGKLPIRLDWPVAPAVAKRVEAQMVPRHQAKPRVLPSSNPSAVEHCIARSSQIRKK